VYVHVGYIDDSASPTNHLQVYSTEVELSVVSYDATGNALATPYNITMAVTHDNKRENIGNFVDFSVHKLPGVHKASVSVSSVVYKDENGNQIFLLDSAVYLELKF